MEGASAPIGRTSTFRALSKSPTSMKNAKVQEDHLPRRTTSFDIDFSSNPDDEVFNSEGKGSVFDALKSLVEENEPSEMPLTRPASTFARLAEVSAPVTEDKKAKPATVLQPIDEPAPPVSVKAPAGGGKGGAGPPDPGASVTTPKAVKVEKDLKKPKQKRSGEDLKPVSLRKLFSFADRTERWMMGVGICCAMVVGCGVPASMLFFGHVLDRFNDPVDLKKNVQVIARLAMIFGGVVLLCGFTLSSCWTIAGERQALRMKKAFVQAILRQEVGWFDGQGRNPGAMPTLVALSMAKVQHGIGRSVPEVAMNLFGAFLSVVVSFYINPTLAAILVACLPAAGLSIAFMAKTASLQAVEGQKHYNEAGSIANEVLGGIRTIASLCSEEHEIERYNMKLKDAEQSGIRQGMIKGFGTGCFFACLYLTYALVFWYGTWQVVHDLDDQCLNKCVTGGDVISAVFGLIFVAVQYGQAAPALNAVSLARSSAALVFDVIDRVPNIDCETTKGLKPAVVTGALTLQGVEFCYPAKPDVKVYKNVSIHVGAGERLALVGPSGGGKSTIAKLLLRFYDPTRGLILLDGIDIRNLNVQWYRSQIGYVGQEAVLFSGSIGENIGLSMPGCTQEDIVAAAKLANAHTFIMQFPSGYDTEVGDGGLQMSGGQKQRIAIARAIIKDPAVLLLDEATSAVDSESEKVIQKALDSLHSTKRRTTVTIAHRLSTIQDSDHIAFVCNGCVAEIGSHTELYALGGLYCELCESQSKETPEEAAVEAADVLMPMLEKMQSSLKKSQVVVQSAPHGAQTGSWISTSRFREGETSVVVRPKLEVERELEGDVAPIGRLWSLNKPNWMWVVMGLIGSLCAGVCFPLEGFIIANLQANYYLTYDSDLIMSRNTVWSLLFVALAGVAVVGHNFSATGFSVASERTTKLLRAKAFTAILKHDIGWFDNEDNSTGNLTVRLEKDASAVSRATGTYLGQIIQALMTVGAGIAIGMVAAWQVALVAIGIIPLVALSGIIQMRMFNSLNDESDAKGLDGGKSANTILSNALNAVTTVHAFNLQQLMTTRFIEATEESSMERTRRGILFGIAFGYSAACVYWSYGILFYEGSFLVSNGTVTFKQFFIAMLSVILGTVGVGQVNADVSAQQKGKVAAARIFNLVDEPLKIDPLSDQGAQPLSASGDIDFVGLHFSYPNRPLQHVYGGPANPEGFSVSVKAGQTLALTGPSGGGKSTCLQLLMRFYDPRAGNIIFDGRNIKELNVHWLRFQFGYVGQEPLLFAGTIMENILRGKPSATYAEVEKAAKAANAHDFILSFRDGYDTDIGEKGALLSGGQKQRVAIARAIVKEPAVLLLDEATSALDNESERVVQAALDKLQREDPRTTLVVAHRLSTIRNADKIAVVNRGSVMEIGTHDELFTKPKSWYKAMFELQTVTTDAKSV